MSGIGSIVLTACGILLGRGKPLPPWLFFVAAAFCFAVACFRVWEKEHMKELGTRAELEALQVKMRGFPRLVATKEDVSTPISGFHSETAKGSPTWEYLCIRFRNDPNNPTPESVALHVFSVIKFFDSDTSTFLYEVSGRWMDSIPPRLGSVGPESVDFDIGQTRTLCIAVKPIGDSVCHTVSKGTWSERESYWMTATEIVASIRLRCPYFDRTWSLRFRNLGERRGLKVLEFRAEP